MNLGRPGAIVALGVIALMSVLGSTGIAADQRPSGTSGVYSAAPDRGLSPPIAVGNSHACALPGDGTVECWGLNYYGELGDGTKTDPNTPAGDTMPLIAHVVIAEAGSASPLTGVSAIAVGLQHTCAVLVDTTVRCWGWNSSNDDPLAVSGTGGQLGDGTRIDRPAPVTVIAAAGSTSPLSGVRAIAAGWFHTCALLLDGTVKCWGDATFRGGLGDGTADSSVAPVTVIAAAGSTSPLSGVVAIATGDFKTCALLDDGTVKCWGDDYVSQLDADGSVEDRVPVAVAAASGNGSPLSGVTAIDVDGGFTQDAGGYVACALMDSHAVKCWGNDDFGGLGDGTTTSSRIPVDVAGIPGDVSATTARCALVVDTTVTCWPSLDADGQPQASPFTVSATDGGSNPLSGVTVIAGGGGETCAVLADRSIACWSVSAPTPTTVPGVVIAAPVVTPEPTASIAPTAEPAATVAPTASPQPAAPGPDLVPGEWSVTYGSPSVVTIAGSGGSYTVTAKGRVQVTGSSCYLPSGTLIATFSGSGGTYAGQHGLWHTSDCSFANWATMTLTLNGSTLTAAVAGTTERPVFRRIGPVTAQLPFRQSLATPGEITLDPMIVAQSLAIAAGVVIFVPFPGILFNRTLEENYPEIMERARRARRRLGARRRLASLVGMALTSARRRVPGGPAGSEPEPLRDPDSPGTAVAPDLALESPPEDRFWTTPVGITLFVMSSALLYGFLDPTFGLDAQSLAAFAGLAVGLVVTLLAFCVPIAVAYRRSAIPFSVRALPGTLVVGLACVLITRLTDFHPGYLYGLVIAFVVARELSVAVEGKAMARAAGSTFVLAVVAWLGLWWVDTMVPGQGDPGPLVIALQTALVMIVVAGVELTVFGMLPLRFLPGEYVRRWSRRAWAGVFGAGLFGFVHVLINPRNGYLADSTRTPIVTIVVLLLLFGLVSVAFWAYFRFRNSPVAPSASP